MKLPKETANYAFWMIVAAVVLIVALVAVNYFQSGKLNLGSLSIAALILLVGYLAKTSAAKE